MIYFYVQDPIKFGLRLAVLIFLQIFSFNCSYFFTRKSENEILLIVKMQELHK